MELGKAGTETVVIHSVERELVLPCEPDGAWEAVADPERLGDWLGGTVEMDPVPGGEFRINFEDGSERVGFVEELDADEHRFAFWWRAPEDELATRVEISLQETDEGTLVRVVETSPLATLDLIGIPLPGFGANGSLPTGRALALA
ncbi:MAG TPA: SRPBCC domain-containing protein [Thermoleophilaceae bacterium]